MQAGGQTSTETKQNKHRHSTSTQPHQAVSPWPQLLTALTVTQLFQTVAMFEIILRLSPLVPSKAKLGWHAGTVVPVQTSFHRCRRVRFVMQCHIDSATFAAGKTLSLVRFLFEHRCCHLFEPTPTHSVFAFLFLLLTLSWMPFGFGSRCVCVCVCPQARNFCRPKK